MFVLKNEIPYSLSFFPTSSVSSNQFSVSCPTIGRVLYFHLKRVCLSFPPYSFSCHCPGYCSCSLLYEWNQSDCSWHSTVVFAFLTLPGLPPSHSQVPLKEYRFVCGTDKGLLVFEVKETYAPKTTHPVSIKSHMASVEGPGLIEDETHLRASFYKSHQDFHSLSQNAIDLTDGGNDFETNNLLTMALIHAEDVEGVITSCDVSYHLSEHGTYFVSVTLPLVPFRADFLKP